jgi:hypothetical protein
LNAVFYLILFDASYLNIFQFIIWSYRKMSISLDLSLFKGAIATSSLTPEQIQIAFALDVAADGVVDDKDLKQARKTYGDKLEISEQNELKNIAKDNFKYLQKEYPAYSVVESSFKTVVVQTQTPIQEITAQNVADKITQFYAKEYQNSFDVDGTRQFTAQKLESFMQTPSWQAIKDHPNGIKFLESYAEMCVSFKSERNPGAASGAGRLPRSPYFGENRFGVRDVMQRTIHDISTGTIEIAISDVKAEHFNGSDQNGIEGCQIPGNVEDLVKKDNERSEALAYSIPNMDGKPGGKIFFTEKYNFDRVGQTLVEGVILHEAKHIFFFEAKKSRDCINMLVTEYDSYMLQCVYEFGDAFGSSESEKNKVTSFKLGEIMEKGFRTSESPYYDLYQTLTEPQKRVWGEMVVELAGPKTPEGAYTGGRLIPVAEFERRLREAK